MRLNSRNFTPEVDLAPDTCRPIRLRVGLSYSMSETEAMELANQIVDAVTKHRHQMTLEETP